MTRRRFLVIRKESMFDGNENRNGYGNDNKMEIEIESYLTEHNRNRLKQISQKLGTASLRSQI